MKYKKLSMPLSDSNLQKIYDEQFLGIYELDDRIEVFFSMTQDVSRLTGIAVSSSEIIEECDWSKEWKKKIKPTSIGTITALPPWLAKESVSENSITIVIDPGMGFGTGEHPTTRGCLALIQKNISRESSFLDFGSGSGILAIAAKKLGTQKVFAIEQDPDAINNARLNAKINNVEIDFLSSNQLPSANQKFDLIAANIQSSVIIPILPELKKRLTTQGILIISGILDDEPFPMNNVKAYINETPWLTLEISNEQN